MAVSGRSVITFLLACALLHCATQLTTTSGTLYDVGGDAGWTFQNSSTFYDDQFKGITVFDTDALNFTFPTGVHSVLIVDETDLASCDTSHPLNGSNNSIIFALPTGTYGFICGFPNHCSQYAMHLNLTVVPSAPAPSQAPPPTSGD